jgi:oxygen-independent coproporphyrinogen-3 oxidase
MYMESELKHVSEHICYNYSMSGDIALYVHLPFCRRKCRYCSFVSYENRENDIPLYLETLGKELKQRSHGERISSIYLGGGTPSLIPVKALGALLNTIAGLFTLDKTAEISMEANPGTVDKAYLKSIRGLGVNRLSLGIQSFNDPELAMLGRIHTADEAKDAARFAREAGFDNLNLDLIYGIPGQAKADWQRSLETALTMKPEHLSLYALTLEHDTPMQLMINEGRLPKIDPDLSADLYELAEDLLEKHGYNHYEISNWALNGRECRHNLVYWHNLPYLGVGAAAHSCLEGYRLANTANLDKYLSAFSGNAAQVPEMDEKIDSQLELAETVILGLRLGEGIKKETIKNRFGIDIMESYRGQIKEMADAGLLKTNNGHLSLTPRGRLLSNEVFWRFLPDSSIVA